MFGGERMESSAANPLASIQQQSVKLASLISSRLDGTRQMAANLLSAAFPGPGRRDSQFASLSHDNNKKQRVGGLSSEQVAKSLSGTSVYTLSNSDNEFILISDPQGVKSIALLSFRHQDAHAFLAQVKSRRGAARGAGGAKVVPITLDQVYMLKVEGIAFRFLPDPVQIQNAAQIKPSAAKHGFDGVPIFQSDLLVVKKKNKRYCPIYFRKEDIEKELSMVSRSRGAGLSQHIMVGSLEDVLKKMEISEKNTGWEDLIFIPPGKSHSQHINEVTKS